MHTPGRWKVLPDGLTVVVDTCGADVAPRVICRCETREDAAAIRALPELYARVGSSLSNTALALRQRADQGWVP